MKIIDQINLGWDLLRRASKPDSGRNHPLEGRKPRTALKWEFGEHASDRAEESAHETKNILFDISAAG